MSKPWGPIGAWALDAERAEAEERENLARNPNPNPNESMSFPPLNEAVAVKPKKKKSGSTMSLSQFTTGTHVGPGGAGRREAGVEARGLTPDEMLRLPTGPRERSVEEMEQGRLGGGFRSYGAGRASGGGGDGSWGGGGGGGGRRSYGGFDDERRSAGPPRSSDFDLPSRADGVDNWAMGKKPVARMDSGRQDRFGMGDSGPGRQDKYASLGGGSRADEVDSWASGKRATVAPPVRSSGGFGSGFRDPVASDSDRWSRSGPLPPREGDRERTRLVLDPPRADASLNDVAKTTRSNPFGAARPREEILAEKGLDWKKLDSEIETKKTSRPTSSHSSRPSSAHSNRPESPTKQVLEVAVKPRPKVNPFGDAKPREVLLEEKGKDWRKIDFELEHRSVDRPETMEEQVLKEEIEHLKKELEKESIGNGVLVQGSGGEPTGLRELIHRKENDLELLIHELDDKIRFGPKASERPGSGAGRSTGHPERTPSLSGMSDEYRNVEYIDRPRSRGNVEYIDRPRSRGMSDVRIRHVDDRRAFQGGREGGFFSSREDRPRSRERW